jgi:PST family polysaccharide transporter
LREVPHQLKQAWSTALSSLTFFAAPAFALLAVTGQDLVVLLLGNKWAEAGAILSILALRGPAHVVERTLGWLHVAAGRADRWRRWGLVSCAALLVALLCGLPFGAIGVAASYTVFMYLLFVPAILYAGRPLGIRGADLYRTVGPQLIGALLVALVGFALRGTAFADSSPLMRLLALTAICGSLYIAIMVLGFRMTKPLNVAASLITRSTSKI